MSSVEVEWHYGKKESSILSTALTLRIPSIQFFLSHGLLWIIDPRGNQGSSVCVYIHIYT
jgi:hypothetical protein